MTGQTEKSGGGPPEESVECAEWDAAYRIGGDAFVWGSQPVPFVAECLTGRRAGLFAGTARSVLDAGCGDGRHSSVLASRSELYVGADICAAAVRGARAHYSGEARSLFIVDDLRRSRLLDAQFDLVFSWGVLSHLRDARAGLSELLSRARPGGLVLVDLFTRNDSSREAGAADDEPEALVGRIPFYYYDEADMSSIIDDERATCLGLEKVQWQDPPHGMLRPRPHWHESWALLLKRRAE